jgi:hypothetical protein
VATIVVNILNDTEHRPTLREDGAIQVVYKAKREGGEEVFRQCVPASAEPAEFNAYVMEQARDESGGHAGDTVRLFGGMI